VIASGRQILDFRKGKEQIARGECEDIDDVIADMEAILEGTLSVENEHRERFDGMSEEQLRKIAETCERSVDDVVRRACAVYLEAGEGGVQETSVRLTYRIGANQVSAARIMKSHGISLRTAHVVITEMVDDGSAILALGEVRDFAGLKRELEGVGVFAERLSPDEVPKQPGLL
jgi:hypothetical protein